MNNDQEHTNAVDEAVRKRAHRHLEVDVAHYEAYLDDPALSARERAEIIKSLWTIISAFVELGFSVHPTQQACGKVQNLLEPGDKSDSTEVQLDRHLQNRNTDAPNP